MEGHDDAHTMIGVVIKSHMIKGKRTKRRRPSSALTLSTSSSTTTATSETSAPATTTSIEFTNSLQDNHANNDHDIANCLMLLAHDGGRYLPPLFPSNMATPRSYVYECKTCDRGFTSFQALGGHRASHNKPHKDVHELVTNKTLSCNIGNPSGSTKRVKVHECSICGSEFTSGQALGGHMRRHRSMTMATSSTGHREFKKHKINGTNIGSKSSSSYGGGRSQGNG